MVKAILKYCDGIDRIQWVDSEPNGTGGLYVNDYVNDGERVFAFSCEIRGRPVYKEIETSIEDFYGHEPKENVR